MVTKTTRKANPTSYAFVQSLPIEVESGEGETRFYRNSLFTIMQ